MNQLTARKLFLFLGAAGALFTLLAVVFPAKELTQVFNGVFLAMVGAATIVFMPLFGRAIRQREFDGINQLFLGIVLGGVSLVGSRSLNVAGQTMGDMNRLSPLLLAGVSYLAVLGAVLHVTAPGMVENRWVYHKGLLILAVLTGLGIGATAILLQTQGL